MRRCTARALLTAAAALLAAALAGCATPPPASDPDALADFQQTNDPLEPTNRVLYEVNDGLDTLLIRPLGIAYRNVLPDLVRSHVHNVLGNLDGPVLLLNDMMQGKPRRAGDTLMRLVINSTVGLAGIFDVATGWGYPAHGTDFGVTLGLWGVAEGPFLYLPVLGPSNPRDAVGYGTDIVIDPFTWVPGGYWLVIFDYSRYAVLVADTRAGLLGDLDKVKAQALDPYATFRSLYRQHRESEIAQTRSDTRATTPDWFPAPAAH